MGMWRVKERIATALKSFREMVSMTRIRFQLTSRGKSNNCLRKYGVQEGHKKIIERQGNSKRLVQKKKKREKQTGHKII